MLQLLLVCPEEHRVLLLAFSKAASLWLLYNKQHLHHLVFLTNSVISRRSIWWTFQIVTRAVSSHLKPAINSIVSQATLLSGESLMAPQKWRNTFIGLLKTSQHQGASLDQARNVGRIFFPRNLLSMAVPERTPKKPEYLIALASKLLNGVRWDSVPFTFLMEFWSRDFWWMCFFLKFGITPVTYWFSAIYKGYDFHL